MEEIVTCGTCGLLQRMELPHQGQRVCARCRFELRFRKPDSRTRTVALALAALILYFPANLLPIVQTDYWGMHQTTTIFDGIRGLFQTGSIVVGCLIFTTSILSPGLKILGLLMLGITLPRPGWERFRTWTYRIIQIHHRRSSTTSTAARSPLSTAPSR